MDQQGYDRTGRWLSMLLTEANEDQLLTPFNNAVSLMHADIELKIQSIYTV